MRSMRGCWDKEYEDADDDNAGKTIMYEKARDDDGTGQIPNTLCTAERGAR